MITVRFPNGFSVQYNSASYVDRCGTLARLYDQKDEPRKWIATVDGPCIIEGTAPCRIYNSLNESQLSAMEKELKALRRAVGKLVKEKVTP